MPRKAISQRMRFAVLRRDNFRCVYCGATGETDRLVIDHIDPFSKGGPDEIGNYTTACHSCNSGKAADEILPAPVSVAYPEGSIESDIVNHVEAFFHADTREWVNCVLDVMQEFPDPNYTNPPVALPPGMNGGDVWAEWQSWCVVEGGRRHRDLILAEFNLLEDEDVPRLPAVPMPDWLRKHYLKWRCAE